MKLKSCEEVEDVPDPAARQAGPAGEGQQAGAGEPGQKGQQKFIRYLSGLNSIMSKSYCFEAVVVDDDILCLFCLWYCCDFKF